MKNEEIKFGAKKILKKLSETYNDLEAFVFYNDEFEQYELVINSVYEEDDEFVKTLNKLLISEIISKKMYLYSYFTDEFEEMASKYLDTDDCEISIISEEFLQNDIKRAVSNYVKKNPEQLDLTITLDTNEDAKRTITIKDDLLIKESVFGDIRPVLQIKDVKNTKEG
ncbi:hypothetical protein JCM16775_0415 [Leptotrichia hofstadii]|uniref:Uncharacterized protein n=1 Tax=Leptotrichia hofstadii TaxID=157688 RepID=A0A510JHL7_9FUSO|nr:hypothetical protein [Leptotrichia hofstadii]BBM37725.1 hypothetical protein JCM16775_0415 [Leptotrichia hofstadii]